MREMSLAWANIGKALNCRAVLFDRGVLSWAKGEAAAMGCAHAAAAAAAGLGTKADSMRQTDKILATGKVDQLLQHEIRDELKRRGASGLGKRWEIASRLQELIDAEKEASVLLPGATPDARAVNVGAEHATATGKPPPSVRDKYASKLSAKVAANLARKGLSMQLEHTQKQETESDQWDILPGVRELLQYVEMRGMMRVLLPNGVEDDSAAQDQAMGITKSLKLSPFTTVVPLDLTEALRRGDGSAIKRLSDLLELEARRMLLVSDHTKTIGAGRSGRAYVCYFARKVEGAPARIPSDFVISAVSDVKDAIEDLNGVTFRTPDTEIKTKYGVNCT